MNIGSSHHRKGVARSRASTSSRLSAITGSVRVVLLGVARVVLLGARVVRVDIWTWLCAVVKVLDGFALRTTRPRT